MPSIARNNQNVEVGWFACRQNAVFFARTDDSWISPRVASESKTRMTKKMLFLIIPRTNGNELPLVVSLYNFTKNIKRSVDYNLTVEVMGTVDNC